MERQRLCRNIDCFLKEIGALLLPDLFIGTKSIIKSVNRHKMQAVIEVEFMGGIRRTTISLEIVKRLSYFLVLLFTI